MGSFGKGKNGLIDISQCIYNVLDLGKATPADRDIM
jgi:hypothetical protein